MPNWRPTALACQPIDLIGRLTLSLFQSGVFDDSVMLPCPSPEPDTHRSPIAVGLAYDLNRTVRGYELVSWTVVRSKVHNRRLIRRQSL